MSADKNTPETTGLSKLGQPTKYRFENPDISLLAAFPHRHPPRG